MQIHIHKAGQSAVQNFNFDQFEFGRVPTDHMLLAQYSDGAWQDAIIEPSRDLQMSPLAMCLHYGQTVFEGMKAYKTSDGNICIFRMEKHFQRMNKSLLRMAMPEVPRDLFMDGIKAVVDLDRVWVSDREGYSLYLRPFVIATEPKLGVASSREFVFMVVCSPMGPYYPRPLNVKVERSYIRAAQGGVGFAKNGGNYGAALYPTIQAQQQGFDQVLWTDAVTHEYLEESGTMNLMFVLDNILITPPLHGTILDGVTRDSLLTLARDMNVEVQERPISVQEIADALQAGRHVEAFGAGTAAMIAPFASITCDDQRYSTYTGPDALMFRLKAQLQGIRTGTVPDIHGWNTIL